MIKFCIAPAGPESLPACLALLEPVARPEVVVLEARGTDGVLAGAAGVLWRSWGRSPGFPAWIHVLPDRRRLGVGRALFAALAATARGEAPALLAAEMLDEASAAAAFAAACGLMVDERQFFFEADAARFLGHMAPIVDRLRRRAPESARIVPIETGLIREVATLVRRELRGAPAAIEAMLRASLDTEPAIAPVDARRSRLLLVDGIVAGALLSRRLPGGRDTQIIGNVVDPRWRRGWANALLLEATTRAGVEDGAQRFRFSCAQDALDTIGLARRGQADHRRTDALFRYALASDA